MKRLLFALVLLFSSACVSFDDGAKKVIVSANDFQDAAKGAYNEAKAEAVTAGKACGEAARLASPPVTPSLEACAALGIPIPYDPEKLNKLADPINAAYEAIRAAEAGRLLLKEGKSTKTNVVAQISLALEAITRFVTAAEDLGVKIDNTKLLEIKKQWEGLL